MKRTFWIGTIFSVILVIFSVQNANEITVKVFYKEVSISLAVLLISVFIFGAISGASYFLLLRRKDSKKTKPALETEELPVEENETQE